MRLFRLMLCNLSRVRSRSSVTNVRYLYEKGDSKELFATHLDNYGGLHFDATSDTTQHIKASTLTQVVLRQIELKDEQVRTLWFCVPSHNARFIEPLVKLGFLFHHTKKDCLILFKPLTERNNVPKYAYTNVGVGGFVVNERDEVLVIKEKHFYLKQMWKLPGGYAEQDEELGDAAVREVFEETGVHSEFRCVLLMRHLHRFAFDCADLYIVCLLRALSEEITQCNEEIAHCRWAPIHQIGQKFSLHNQVVLERYRQWLDSPLEMRPQTIKTNYARLPRFTVYSLQAKEGDK